VHDVVSATTSPTTSRTSDRSSPGSPTAPAIASSSRSRRCTAHRLNPLWEKFHGIRRPDEPSADDLVAVLHEHGVRALAVDRWVRVESDTSTPEERISMVTRRLCLPVEREPEVAVQLADQPPLELRRMVTLSWRGSAR